MNNIEEVLKKEGLTLKDFPILIIDDEESYLEDIKSDLERYFKVYTTSNITEVPTILKKHNICILASDQRMPKKTGVEVLQETKKDFPNLVRILITGYTDYDAALAAINSGEVYRYIPKKCSTTEKVTIFKQSLEIFFLREYERKTRELDKALILNKPQPSK